MTTISRLCCWQLLFANRQCVSKIVSRAFILRSIPAKPNPSFCARAKGVLNTQTPAPNYAALFRRFFQNGHHKHVKKNEPLPFEVNARVVRDTVIYSYSNDRLYRMISIFGVVQFIFWANLAVFAYGGFGTRRSEDGQLRIETESVWGKVIQMQEKYKYRIAFCCMAVGYMVLFFTWLYPQRSISQLALLKGGQNVRLTTYTHLGRKREFTLPLDHIHSTRARHATKAQVSLKIKNSWFYYLMDKNFGTFHEPKLFDYVIALHRK